LLSRLLDEAVQKGLITNSTEIDELKRQIDLDALELANFLEERFSRKIFRARFAKIFSNPRGECTSSHKIIADLKLRSIITLNYDNGHEVAYAHSGRNPNTGRSQDESTVTRWLQGDVFHDDDPPILHLHGDVSDPEKMILTADDYDQFYQSSLQDTLIQQLWRSNRLLAIGFGFSDPFLTRVAQTMLRLLPSETRHFALIGQRDEESVSEYQRQAFAKKFRLTPVFYRIRRLRQEDHGVVDDHSELIELLRGLPRSAVSNVHVSGEFTGPGRVDASTRESTSSSMLTLQTVELEFQKELFHSPHGKPLYVEPKLTLNSDVNEDPFTAKPTFITISEIVRSSDSYVIAVRPEYGATTFARRILIEFLKVGKQVLLQEAPALPNYKRKLQELFENSGISPDSNPILIIDRFSFGENERLLKEVIGTGVFRRIIVLASVNMFATGNAIPIDQFSLPFKLLALSSLSIEDIRSLTDQFFDTSDTDRITLTAHKVYSDLAAKLEQAVKEFEAKYLPESFDPFAHLDWPSDPREEENLWKPLAEMVAKGPRNPNELDEIKRSLVDERRTENQTVVIQNYDRLERRLLRLQYALVEALKNSDALPGDLKKRAVIAALRAYFRMYQVGLVFASEIASRPYFVWHGFVFVNKVQFGGETNEKKRTLIVASAVHSSIIRKIAEEMGSKKFGEVFKLLAKEEGGGGYLGLMNFACLLRSKSKSWHGAASVGISKMDRKALELRVMLNIAFEQLNNQVNTGGEREELKKIIATIRIKRDLRKDNPGKQHLSRVVIELEKRDYFEKSRGTPESSAIAGDEATKEEDNSA
jgi:hypothetical protein